MAQPPTSPSSVDAQRLLGVLLGQLQSAQALASGSDADAFASACQRLSQTLGEHQKALAQCLAQTEPSAEITLQLQKLGTGLALLRDVNLRQGAATQRALGTLFPQEQVNAYQRLGARAGAAGGFSSGLGGSPPRSSQTGAYKA